MSKKSDSFQAQMNELEQIVSRFESGEIDLDQALGEFERGLELAASLKKRLQIVDNKVTEIRQKFVANESEAETNTALADSTNDDTNSDSHSDDAIKQQLF